MCISCSRRFLEVGQEPEADPEHRPHRHAGELHQVGPRNGLGHPNLHAGSRRTLLCVVGSWLVCSCGPSRAESACSERPSSCSYCLQSGPKSCCATLRPLPSSSPCSVPAAGTRPNWPGSPAPPGGFASERPLLSGTDGTPGQRGATGQVVPIRLLFDLDCQLHWTLPLDASVLAAVLGWSGCLSQTAENRRPTRLPSRRLDYDSQPVATGRRPSL